MTEICVECDNLNKEICKNCVNFQRENFFKPKKSNLTYFPCVLYLNNNERGDIVNALRAQAPNMRNTAANKIYKRLAHKVDAAGGGEVDVRQI